MPGTNEDTKKFRDIGERIKAGELRKIVICAGAGISTAAGIPDFRSPKTGLYHNLKRLNLDYPEQVFDIDFFRRKPEPFFELAKELYPGNFLPTLTHCFIKLLYDKGLLLRCFTQNIDTLERRTGLPGEKIVEAHGSFAGNHCISARCGLAADAETTEQTIRQGSIPRCKKCKSLVKPDIVFFGEGLPELFFERLQDFKEADLLIVMGTSLQVQPFASLHERVDRKCPRVLLNLQDVGNFTRPTDVIQLAKCDESVQELADICGWGTDLKKVFELWHKVTEVIKVQPDEQTVASETEDKVDKIVEKLKGTNL